MGWFEEERDAMCRQIDEMPTEERERTLRALGGTHPMKAPAFVIERNGGHGCSRSQGRGRGD